MEQDTHNNGLNSHKKKPKRNAERTPPRTSLPPAPQYYADV